MESLFHSFDCRNNPVSGFWQKIQDQSEESIFSTALFSGDLKIFRPNKGLKRKKIILTKSNIYLLSKWKIPKYKACINWKLVEPFEEKQEDLTRFGFRLYGNAIEDFYTNSSLDLNKWLEKLSQVCILTSFEEDFLVLKELSRGASATVRLCQSLDDLSDFAVKSVHKSLINKKPGLFQYIINEISILRTVDHPNIVKLFRVYETEEEIHLVLENLEGGDAYKRLSKIKRLNEKAALFFVYKILSIIDYLHSLNIVHRDLKLENIAFCNKNFEDFKLIDFGLAVKNTEKLSEKCGTVGFIAPEVLKGLEYDNKADIFSVGVILYIILTGKQLFIGKNLNEIHLKNKECAVPNSTLNIRSISKSTKKLLKDLLSPDPFFRLSASDALNEIRTKNKFDPEHLYKLNCPEFSFLDKGNTTDSVNKSNHRYEPLNNNYIHPL